MKNEVCVLSGGVLETRKGEMRLRKRQEDRRGKW